MTVQRRYAFEFSYIQRAWTLWKRFGHFMGDIVGRVVLTIFYFTIFLPFGIGVRLLSDHLDTKQEKQPSWQSRPPVEATMENARRLA
jgi:hypothetical protein